jgi:hypothetical protein
MLSASLGSIPKKIVICMIETDRFHGVIGHSPFVFKPFNWQQMSLFVNSVQVPQGIITSMAS